MLHAARRTATPQRNYAHHAPVNDLALHSNQGELISCDQNGAIKVWDLGGDRCSHELVRRRSLAFASSKSGRDSSQKRPRSGRPCEGCSRPSLTLMLVPHARSCLKKTCRCALSRSRRTARPSSAATTRSVLPSSSFLPSPLSFAHALSFAPAGRRVRVDDPARPRLHRPAAQDALPGALAVLDPGPRLARYQVRHLLLSSFLLPPESTC